MENGGRGDSEVGWRGSIKPLISGEKGEGEGGDDVGAAKKKQGTWESGIRQRGRAQVGGRREFKGDGSVRKGATKGSSREVRRRTAHGTGRGSAWRGRAQSASYRVCVLRQRVEGAAMGLHMRGAGNAWRGCARDDVGNCVRGSAWGALYMGRAFGGRGKSAATGLNMNRVVASAAGP